MPQATYQFPAGFLWGTATAAHQVEGQNTNNNWYRWEQEDHILQGHRSGLACDWWGGRWQEDMDRAAETGQNAHRLSVEWSRIQPTPDTWDESALEAYRNILQGMIDRGLTPMVTLHHFTDPLWLYERGGWEAPETPQIFARFVQKVVEALKEQVSLWVTINEPNVYMQGGYIQGAFPPGKTDLKAAATVFHNLLLGHAYAYKAIHQSQRTARVGVAHHFRSFWPAKPWFPPDRIAARIFNQNMNYAFANGIATGKFNFLFRTVPVPEALNTHDFFGVNYYTGDRVAVVPWLTRELYTRRTYPKDALISEGGFLANTPYGLLEFLKWSARFNRPILITENGVEDSTDRLRPRYTIEHLYQVWRAATATIPVKGYFHWSLVDNFEWERGWTQRFGLWGLDPETQQRTRRGSVDLYADICRRNALTWDTVNAYAPEIVPALFPA
jgi:beta-glucosidase